MGTFERLQRKSSISSARADSASSFQQPSRPFAPAAASTHDQVSPDQQTRPAYGADLRYSLARIPIFSVERENHTGMPDRLKTGIENLSGISLHDVRVHYNSSKPAQVQALAYTQGVSIHIGAGQEKHLPHEAWHVVQQKQGRVRPTVQAKGVGINDDEELEREADVMGAKAFQGVPIQTVGAQENQNPASNAPVQMEDGGYQRALYQLAGVLGIAGSAQAIEDTITSSTGISYGTLSTLFLTLGAVFVAYIAYHVRTRTPVNKNVKKEEAKKEIEKSEPPTPTGRTEPASPTSVTEPPTPTGRIEPASPTGATTPQTPEQTGTTPVPTQTTTPTLQTPSEQIEISPPTGATTLQTPGEETGTAPVPTQTTTPQTSVEETEAPPPAVEAMPARTREFVVQDFDDWKGRSLRDFENYRKEVLLPRANNLRERIWALRFIDEALPRRQLNEFTALNNQLKRPEGEGLVESPLIGALNLAINFILTVESDSEQAIKNEGLKNTYYLQLARAIVETVDRNPGILVQGASQESQALFQQYQQRIGNLRDAYRTAIGQVSPATGIGTFIFKGITFDVHTKINNYISVHGQPPREYPKQPLTPEKFRNITLALLSNDNKAWQSYDPEDLAIYLGATVAETVRYAPATYTNLIAFSETKQYTEQKYKTIFDKLVMTTGGTDPIKNPTVPRTNPPATIKVVERERDIILGTDRKWLETKEYLANLQKSREQIIQNIIEVKRDQIVQALETAY